MNLRRRLACLIDPTFDSQIPKYDLVDLVREQLKGIVVDTHFIDDLTREERLDFCEKALDVWQNPTFSRTIDYLISQQVDYTVKRAGSMDEVSFGRATINGLSLVKEEFGRLAALAQEHPPEKMTKEETSEII